MGDNYRRSVKIFIGGLSFETTDEALKRYFERFGPVADAIVMKDAVSRRSRGFGFITYVNAASVDAALSVEQHIVDNRRVEAKRAVPRSEVPSKIEGSLAQSPSIQPQGSWDAPFGMENYVLRGVGGEGRTRSNSTVSASSIGGIMAMDGAPMANKVKFLNPQGLPLRNVSIVPGRTWNFPRLCYLQIFVGGLHYETRDASLHAYFEQFGPVQTAEVMFNRETHKSRGFGFVVFESEESANAVLQSTHHTVNGKVVEVKRAVPRAQSSTAGSNPNSPAMMGYHPSSPSAVGGPGMLGKSAAAGPKRPQRSRAQRETMVAPSNGAVPASPQQRFPPTTSYAAVLRYGAGRQHHSSVSPHGGGKPPQHHTHMSGRDEIGGFRLSHSTHGGYSIPPGAAARAEAAAAQAFVRELKAWDVENSGQGLNFEEPFDYYSDQQRASTLRDYAKHVDMEGIGGAGSGDTNFSTGLHGHTSWPSEARAAWTQQSQGGNIGRQQQHQQQPRLQQPQQHQRQRSPAEIIGLLAHNRPEEDVSPRRLRQHSAFFSRGSDPSTTVLYRSSTAPNGEGYHCSNHGHPPKTFSEAPNGRLLSPGEGGGTPALMSSSPLLRDGGLLETAFADLKLDGTTHAVAMNSSVVDGPAPNGDGPSLLNEIGGGGPPSAASEAVPYGRAGGETAVDGGGGTDGLASCGVWSADAFGSALGVNVLSTANDIMGTGGPGMSERKDITGGGLSDHFGIGALGPASADGATTQLRWH